MNASSARAPGEKCFYYPMHKCRTGAWLESQYLNAVLSRQPLKRLVYAVVHAAYQESLKQPAGGAKDNYFESNPAFEVPTRRCSGCVNIEMSRARLGRMGLPSLSRTV